jgi:preprotein translocase SecE subunit
VARQTRQERRERRAQEPAFVGAPPAAPPPRPTRAAGGDAQPRPEPHRVPGSGARGFVGESIGELKKVEWPNQKQVITGTTAVLLACLVVGVFLFANDLVWKHVVKWLI